MKNVLLSPTAYKGTISPNRAAHLLKKAFQSAMPSAHARVFPLADGGDGTLDVLLTLGGRRIRTKVKGPLGRPVVAEWGLLAGNQTRSAGRTAVIEMARASGLALVKGKNRILEATTFGTGELIRAALDRRCRTLYIGVGGTATSDGGAGAMEALGLRYFDRFGRRLSAAPRALERLARVDDGRLDRRLRKTKIYVLCDVKNPLLGRRGSARTFGPQKGATTKDVLFLESVLWRWSSFARRQTRDWPGAGAAGGLAFGLSAFAGARLVNGTPEIIRTLRWERAAQKADLIVTGEGRMDETSFFGKVTGEIARRRGEAKVAVLCGSTTVSRAYWKRRGIVHVETMGRAGLQRPEKAFFQAALRLAHWASERL